MESLVVAATNIFVIVLMRQDRSRLLGNCRSWVDFCRAIFALLAHYMPCAPGCRDS